jgi:hypothetical protein
VSQFCIAHDDGAVPRSPIPPVVKGLSSGKTALPSRALATGAPSRSASCVISSRADSAPCPASTATRDPALRIAAAARNWSGAGADSGGLQDADERAPGLRMERLSADSFIICTSLPMAR